VPPSRVEPPHLLVVEDDAEICEGLAVLLREEGYGVSTASSPDEALRLIDQQVFVLIVTDLFKHTLHHALDSVTELRDRAHPTPVGVMTAWNLSLEEVERSGFAFLVSKPYDLDAFLTTIAAAVGTPLNAEQQRHRQVALRYFDALSLQDWDALRDLCSERVTYVLPGSTQFSATVEGRAAFYDYTHATFRHFPRARFDNIAVFVTPNGIAARYRATWQMPGAGEVQQSGSVIFRFDRDDQISQIGVRLNDERFGVLFAPVATATAHPTQPESPSDE
jgi:CheY-like chemotaxis protein/ketosteroid isomerase-like protein